MRSMVDAAWPPLGAGVKADIINRYIGGGTPHVWTQAETDQMLRETGAKGILPNFVRVPPTTRDPSVEAAWCVQWMLAHGQPAGTCVALDYETAIDNAYWTRFDDVIMAAGYRTLLYGTLRTVVQNVTSSGRRPSGGYWSAHWNNTPHICPNPGVTATQYGGDVTIGKPWDISLVGDGVPIWGYTQEADVLTDEQDRKLTFIFDVLNDRLGDGTPIDHETKLYRLLAWGTETKGPGRPNLTDLAAAVVDLKAAVDALTAGVPVTLTDAQLESIKASLQTLEGSALVQLAVSPAVP